MRVLGFGRAFIGDVVDNSWVWTLIGARIFWLVWGLGSLRGPFFQSKILPKTSLILFLLFRGRSSILPCTNNICEIFTYTNIYVQRKISCLSILIFSHEIDHEITVLRTIFYGLFAPSLWISNYFSDRFVGFADRVCELDGCDHHKILEAKCDTCYCIHWW